MGRAGKLAVALALSGVALVCVELGSWQLRRAADRDALTAAFAAGAQLRPLDTLPARYAPTLRYRPVALSGRYLPDVQILLDNMTHNGVAGYEVLTAFRPESRGPAVAVNRGWLPAALERTELPAVAVDGRRRTVRGRIDRLPVPALRLAAPTPTPGAVRVMSFPEITDLERELGMPLAPFQLLLDAEAADGYLRDWQPSRGPDSRRNRVYAVQWYLMAAAALLGAFALLLGFRRQGRA